MAKPLQCPQCGNESVVRTSCFSPAERVAGLLFVSPFRCQACSFRFLAFRLGRRYPMNLVDRREYKRIPVRLFLSFSGGRVRGDGTVLDISMGGCVIKSKTQVKAGDIFYLQIVLAEQQPPVEVAGIVRSVSDRGISFKFLRAAQENKRLLEFLHGQSGGAESTVHSARHLLPAEPAEPG